ncbi:UNVERIFIED_CONTAM: hypothetical protein GTU68_033941 [Idotea baltica]|nr:hypothetical protein [Idotea baltica]
MSYSHILVAIDLTADCNIVLKKAHELAETYQARLSITHVMDPINMAFGGEIPVDISSLQQQQFEQTQKQLHAIIENYPLTNQERLHLSFGQTRQEIHNLTEEINCDLIVVGTHGRHGIALLFGSTANEILHGTSCDILAVKLDEKK